MKLADLLLENKGLAEDEVFTGLVDYGLFCEKVPPCFTSEGLSSVIDKTFANLLSQSDEKKLRKEIDKRSHDYIHYEALRDINIPRHFGIPHPESYVLQALAIKKHWTEIKAHCEKPTSRVSRIHVRRINGERIFEMNYKGTDRFQLEEDEIEWAAGTQFVVNADISACFPSIYTHSIPWALHGREDAKKKRGLLALAGNLLDKCTQNIRDGQTNGLLIGPHSSNIISEIILTRVDVLLLDRGYRKLRRYIDDYEFCAASYAEAEKFLHDLGLALRKYELTINEQKTEIVPVPRPSTENWKRELNRFFFPKGEEVIFSTVRSFLDLALELAQAAGTSAPLNYAIKMMPDQLNQRAKRLYVQETINLALAYPYLAPYLDQHVFDKYPHEEMDIKIADFANNLVRLGIQKLYPDAIAHGMYFALKHGAKVQLNEAQFQEILKLDDCIVSVLLLEYAKKHKLKKIESAIKKRSQALKKEDARDQDRQWLLIYQTWSEVDLSGTGQVFLSLLKGKKFRFFTSP